MKAPANIVVSKTEKARLIETAITLTESYMWEIHRTKGPGEKFTKEECDTVTNGQRIVDILRLAL